MGNNSDSCGLLPSVPPITHLQSQVLQAAERSPPHPYTASPGEGHSYTPLPSAAASPTSLVVPQLLPSVSSPSSLSSPPGPPAPLRLPSPGSPHHSFPENPNTSANLCGPLFSTTPLDPSPDNSSFPISDRMLLHQKSPLPTL